MNDIVLNQGSRLPSCFRIANQEIKVVLVEDLNNKYGYFNDAISTIKLARSINTEYDGVVMLSDEQIRNTFYHELMHVFQFYFDNVYDEKQAQVYANFICEFLDSTDKPF